MCMVSNVYDQWNPWFPSPSTVPVTQPTPIPTPIVIQQGLNISPEDLRLLIKSFHKAVEAAKVFDQITGQPDCEDPDKAKLEERVAELEKRLAELEKNES